MGSKYFLVVICGVHSSFSCVFHWLNIFSSGYFVGPKLFFIGDNFVVHAKDLSLNRVYLMRSFNHWVPIVQCKSGQNLVI